MRTTPACLGGWCKQRETCEHYQATHRTTYVERLCDMGHDGEMTERQIVVHRPAGDWERPGASAWMAQAGPFDCLWLPADAPLFADVEVAA